jgi:hypothetical protein
METTTPTTEHDGAPESGESPPDGSRTEIQPTITAGVREHCSECNAQLAADQRYCVECGHRRGDPRFPITEALARRAPAAPAPPRRRFRPSASSTLIAGIGTLLLAMAVGVLIGRSSDHSSGSSKPVVVTVGGGAAASGAGGTAAAAGAGATAAASGGGGKSGGKAKTKNGSSGGGKSKAPPPKVVTVGSPGKGPGYQNGKFTGNFFGQ